jgi:hypothetical protein
MRMQMRRFTRLTNAFSKNVKNHMHMVAIYTVWYNWIRMHKSLRVTPAMAASLRTRLWGWEEIVASMDAAEQPKKRGPYLGYGEIGARLAAEAGEMPYRGWIDKYAGNEYQDECRSVGRLIDRALERRLGPGWAALPRWQQLCRRFEVATRLEVGFWGMSLRGP